MDTPITRAEYEEHNRRMEDEHHRVNRRLELLEKTIQQNGSIALSVEKLANNMEGMLKEQERQGERLDAQGKRLETLEKGPGDTWGRIKAKVLDAVVGAIASAFAVGVVLLIAQYIK